MVRVPYTTDQEWVAALMAGRVTAWGDVPNQEAGIPVSGLLGMLYGWAERDIGDPDQAKDIAIEAAGQVLRHLDGFRGEAPFKSWLGVVYRSVLWKRAPGSQYKVRYKLERWLKSADKRGLEQQRAASRAIRQLTSEEQQILNLIKQGQTTEQIANTLEATVLIVRGLKAQGMSKLLHNQDFMTTLTRVGNKIGAQKDKLAANIVAAYWELQEISIEDLLKSNETKDDDVEAWDVLSEPDSMPEADLSALSALSDQTARFWECVDQLPESKKVVIQLTWRYRSGPLSNTSSNKGANRSFNRSIDEQIAQDLGIAPQLVRLRRFQAKTPLKRCLGKED